MTRPADGGVLTKTDLTSGIDITPNEQKVGGIRTLTGSSRAKARI
jgi:hypothetical protein